MAQVAEELAQFWQSRLLADCPQQRTQERESIVRWLLGEEWQRLQSLSPEALAATKKGMEYRYCILQQRYLTSSPSQAYRNLIDRLGSLIVLRQKIRTWVSLSRDRRQTVTEVLQEIIQEMLNSDRYLRQQLSWIAECTSQERLRNSLLFATLEEYCLRQIRQQPLIAYRFLNFLQRCQRGGLTQVPQQQAIQTVSSEIEVSGANRDSATNLLDIQAALEYYQGQRQQEQQSLRLQVRAEFAAYLRQTVGEEAVQWLGLYLQSLSQEEIAARLNLSVKQVYRLREKVGYHAIRAFALKGKPELVAEWLEISVRDHNLGLTPQQWENFSQSLTPIQRRILQQLKIGQSLAEIGESCNWKKSQVTKEWSQMYLAAQTLRSRQ